MSVVLVNYVAQRIGYDTEECIQVALEDGEIELYLRNPGGYRDYDIYRLIAKGRRACDRHIREVYQRSAEAARRLAEEQRREGDPLGRRGTAAPAGKPPPQAAGNCFCRRNSRRLRRRRRLLGGTSLPAGRLGPPNAPLPGQGARMRPALRPGR